MKFNKKKCKKHLKCLSYHDSRYIIYYLKEGVRENSIRRPPSIDFPVACSRKIYLFATKKNPLFLVKEREERLSSKNFLIFNTLNFKTINNNILSDKFSFESPKVESKSSSSLFLSPGREKKEKRERGYEIEREAIS